MYYFNQIQNKSVFFFSFFFFIITCTASVPTRAEVVFFKFPFLFYTLKHPFWLTRVKKQTSDGYSSDLIVLDLCLFNSAAVTTR